MKKQTYIYAAIDLKSFYASVECKERNLDPLTTHLVVADASRSSKTICLAVSPSLKQLGISGRPRLFEVIQSVKELNQKRLYNTHQKAFQGTSYDAIALQTHTEYAIDYITAPPRMALYLQYSTNIYNIYINLFLLSIHKSANAGISRIYGLFLTFLSVDTLHNSAYFRFNLP